MTRFYKGYFVRCSGGGEEEGGEGRELSSPVGFALLPRGLWLRQRLLLAYKA